ncbi:uncharacterized protein BDV14DRAFT_191880 [Aspergillus stella-maris]|uniref:uncharacterized protein n=1 Tax=Aspergillus stella-maris TaxID=1810926 RepID=UPI003CCD9F36
MQLTFPPDMKQVPVHGPLGSASAMFLTIRLASLVHTAAAAECFSLAAASDVSTQLVNEIVGGAAGSSAQFNHEFHNAQAGFPTIRQWSGGWVYQQCDERPDPAISAPPDGRYLYRTATGEPFLWKADTNWELFHPPNKTDVDLYLADRAAKDFNVIQAVLLSKYNVTTIPNFYGDLAIDNGDPTRPNENYFGFVDWATARAAEYGILICFVPVWGRHVSGGWYGTIGRRQFNEDNAEAFGRGFGRRYPGTSKILGGYTNGFWANNDPQARQAWRDRIDDSVDPTSFLDPIEDTRGIWAAMMKGFKEEERILGYEALLTFQPTSPWISDPPTPLLYGHNYINGSLGTLSMDAVQSGHENPNPDGIDANFTVLTPWDSTKNYENILQMRSDFCGPVMDVKNHYEGAHDSFDTEKPLWNASHVRHGFCPALFSGACGITYGSLPVQQSYENISLVASLDHYHETQLGLAENTSWHEAIHWPGAKQAGYYLRSPGGIKVEDIFSYASNRYIAAITIQGRYWIYTGYVDAFGFDLAGVMVDWGYQGGEVEAQWFDPRTAHTSRAEHKVLERASKNNAIFTPPSSGGVDHDWALILKSTSHLC